MAALRINNIYLDQNMAMFLDEQRSSPFPGPLFQRQGSPTCCMDEDLTIVANLLEAEEDVCDESAKENVASTSTSSLAANQGFSRLQTLFLIDQMREQLEKDGDGCPQSLKELNMRLKNSKGNKKNLWKSVAENLSLHFVESFHPDKVAWKWNTLVDAYKKVKDNNKSTGKGAMRFQFFEEMEQLLGGQHDVVFPVIGAAAGLEVRRPELLVPDTPTPSRKQRRDQFQDELLQFFRDSEEACDRRHNETMQQLRTAQESFDAAINRLIEKM